jgi:hypothetical protein
MKHSRMKTAILLFLIILYGVVVWRIGPVLAQMPADGGQDRGVRDPGVRGSTGGGLTADSIEANVPTFAGKSSSRTLNNCTRLASSARLLE